MDTTITIPRELGERLAAIVHCTRYHADGVPHPDCPACQLRAALAPKPATDPAVKGPYCSWCGAKNCRYDHTEEHKKAVLAAK